MEISPTYQVFPGGRHSSNIIRVTWANVTENDTCGLMECGDFADRSVQFVGTFGGATARLQGSNDGTNFVDMTDPQGNAISKSAASLEAITEQTYALKPTFSGGSGQSVTVTVVGRRAT